MSNIYLRNKEGVAMMLRQHINSGFASPAARTALYKIQKAPGGTVNLSPPEAEAIMDVYGSFAEDYYWTPIEEGSSLRLRGETARPTILERFGPPSYSRDFKEGDYY